MLAWQRDAIGPGQESIALIAYDEAGMSEAVGSLYEALAGLEPLTHYVPPRASSIAAANATSIDAAPEAPIAWEVRLSDRALAMRTEPDRLVSILTADGTLAQLDGVGRIVSKKTIPWPNITMASQELAVPTDTAVLELARQHAPPDRIVKHAVSAEGRVAVSYWGGTVQMLAADGSIITSQMLPQDVTGLAWLGNLLVVGLADGRVVALTVP
jgi:hypothetical protein